MSCVCDDGCLEFSSSEWRTARKTHRCEECWQSIAKGDRYRRVSGKWEGAMFVYSLHESCSKWGQAFAAAARAADHCDCWELGSLWSEAIPEFCREVLGYDPHERRTA